MKMELGDEVTVLSSKRYLGCFSYERSLGHDVLYILNNMSNNIVLSLPIQQFKSSILWS